MPQVANTTAQLKKLVETAVRKYGIDDGIGASIAIDAVDFIVEIYGGRRIFIPMYQAARVARNAAICAALAAGKDPKKLSRQYGISSARVLRIGQLAAAGQATAASPC